MPIQITGTVRCGRPECGAESVVTVFQPTDVGNAVDRAMESLKSALNGWQATGPVRCPGCSARPGSDGMSGKTQDGGDSPNKQGARRGLATVGQSH